MATNYPAGLDTFPTLSAANEIASAHQNDRGDAIEALEVKLGVDGSAVPTSIDYLVKHAASIDPGHKHTLAGLSFSGLTAGHALFASSATAVAFRAIQESDIADGAILARVNATETIGAVWTYQAKPRLLAGLELAGAGSESVTHAAAAGAGAVTYSWPSAFADGQFLKVTTGGILVWDTVAGGGGGGWQDDGTVIRPAALTDQVAIGTASPVAGSRLHVNAQSATDLLAVLRHAATPTASWLQCRRSDDSVALELTSAGALKLKDTQALVLLPSATNTTLGYSNGSSGYLVVECDAEGSLGTGVHCAAKFFSDTTVFFGDLAKTQGASGAQMTVVPRAVGTAAMILRGRAGQTNDLLIFQTSTPATLGTVSAAGLLTMPAITVSGGGALRLNGATSGFVGLMAPAAAGSTTYTVPASDGSAGQVLTTNGAGTLTWTDKAGGAGGSSALSAITAAAANNSIANGAFTQTWQWALGATTNVAMTFAEAAAASNTSTLVKIAGITGSTATLLQVVHPDTNAKAVDIDGGVVRIKTKYLTLGPNAPWVTTAGLGVFDALVRWTGTFSPNPGGYGSSMRVAAFTSSDLKYDLPLNPPTNMGEQVVFYGLHCGFEASGGWSSSYTAGYSLFGADITLDIGQNVPDFHTMVAVLGEVNWNYTDTAASNLTACFTASINSWQSATRNSKMAAFWLRPSSGMSISNEFALPSNKTFYGLLTPPMAVLSPIPYYRWKPLHIQGDSGSSFHGPRIDFGASIDSWVGSAFTGESEDNYAAVTITGKAARTVSDYPADKYILALIDSNANQGRVAFYRAGGMRLVATATPGPSALLGSLYVDSDDSNLYFHNGSTWVNLSGGGGGGGGWQDDGTTVRLVTTSDKVVIGTSADSGGVAKHLYIETANGATGFTMRQGSGVTEDFVRCLTNGGVTLWSITSSGGMVTSGTIDHRESAGATRCFVEVASTHGNVIIGGGTSKRGTGLQNGLVLAAGQTPSTSPADVAALYAKDAAAGNCWPAFKPEDGVERFILGVESVNTSLSTGVGAVKLAGVTDRDNAGWLKTHRETGATVYVPYWTNIN